MYVEELSLRGLPFRDEESNNLKQQLCLFVCLPSSEVLWFALVVVLGDIRAKTFFYFYSNRSFHHIFLLVQLL